MKKLLFFLLLTTAVVGRAQTSLDLLPVGTEAPDFTITDSKTGKKIFQLSDKKTQKDKDGKTVQCLDHARFLGFLVSRLQKRHADGEGYL